MLRRIRPTAHIQWSMRSGPGAHSACAAFVSCLGRAPATSHEQSPMIGNTTGLLHTSKRSLMVATRPLQQGLPVVKQAQDDPDQTLMAKSNFCIFVLTSVTSSDKKVEMSLYTPTLQKLLVFEPTQVHDAIAFVTQIFQDNARFDAAILFPSEQSAAINSVAMSVKEGVQKAQSKFFSIGPDAWTIVFGSHKTQKEHVKGIELPKGFDHACSMMHNKRFDPINTPEIRNVMTAASVGGADVYQAGVVRRALVVWDALLNVHKKFGTAGSKKAQSAIDLVIRRAVKAVNIFGVDMDIRIGKGSVVDGITMVVTIFNAQTGTNTVHAIRNLAEDNIKLNVLTTLLYGEGMSSVTLLFPSPRTKVQQLTAFARTCRPKCPFFVVEPTALAPFFGQPASEFNYPEVHDPKQLFQKMIATCFPGSAKKDEDTNGKKVVQALTHIGHKMFDQRVGVVVSNFGQNQQVGSMPPPLSAVEDFELSSRFAATDRVFVNAVNVKDMDVIQGLAEWKRKIYQNPDRKRREQEAVNSIRRYLIVDLETTTVKRYKRIANPFTQENHVVLSGALDFKGNIFIPSEYYVAAEAKNYPDPAVCAANTKLKGASKCSLFLPPLDDYDVIVGHNVKFDLLHLWKDVELRKFLKRGGKIWDTMYGEYLLSGHLVKLGRGAGLEDVAKSYGGQTPKLDEVKQAWAQGKQTYEIPYATLKEYLIGDLKNTELIFKKHLDRALEQRQAIICNARMDSLLATTEMEFNGLKTDVALAIRQSNEIVAKASELKSTLDASIPDEIDPRLKKYFNWASNQMVIPYFFGGKVKLNTANRESKSPSGEKVPRHLLFSSADYFPASQFPNGVFLASQQNSSGPGDCVAVSMGGEVEKGNRVFSACIDSYMKQAGFRKSSVFGDCMTKQVVAVDRRDATVRSEPDAIANLLPERLLMFFAAVAPSDAGCNVNGSRLESLTLRQAITGETVTFNLTKDFAGDGNVFAAKIEEYIRSQVVAHTKSLLPPSLEADPSMLPDAFVDAQVLLIARDAPFSFKQALYGIAPLEALLTRRSAPSKSDKPTEQFSISLVDATAALQYHRHMFGDETYAAWTIDRKSSKSVPPSNRDLVILPEFVPEPQRKAVPPFAPHLQLELLESPETWCKRYDDMFTHIAYRSMIVEGDEIPEAKKAKKNAPPPRPDESLPLLLRRRAYVVGAWKEMPSDRQKKIALMILLGRGVGTGLDSFVEPSPFADTVEIPLKGRLSLYVKEEEIETVLKKFRSPATRQLQVGDESLMYFAKTHKDKVANVISDLRAMDKLIGTYYEHTEGGTGMVSLAHSIDSCIHHELIHNKTSTGRLASANPNCQNIPKEDKSPLREMFVSRFENGMCIEADYSQLEVITLAALSNDTQMIEDLRNNVDFHCKRVTMIRHDLSYEEVLQRAKKNKEPDFVKLRQQAKIFSFQRQYGAGVAMLSASTGLTPDQVKTLIERERQIYKGCDVFTNIVTLSANTFDASLQDGSRNIRGHQLYKGMFPVITGSRYVFTESDVPEVILKEKPSSFKSTNFSPTHLKNYPVQGFAGEIVQIMLGKLWRHFVNNENYGGKAVLTNTVHDCVWVDTTRELYEEVAADVDRIMSSAKTELNKMFPEMECTVEFPVDVVAGENMCHLRGLPKKKTA